MYIYPRRMLLVFHLSISIPRDYFPQRVCLVLIAFLPVTSDVYNSFLIGWCSFIFNLFHWKSLAWNLPRGSRQLCFRLSQHYCGKNIFCLRAERCRSEVLGNCDFELISINSHLPRSSFYKLHKSLQSSQCKSVNVSSCALIFTDVLLALIAWADFISCHWLLVLNQDSLHCIFGFIDFLWVSFKIIDFAGIYKMQKREAHAADATKDHDRM